MHYDAVGNLDNDSYTGACTRTYDAENKITSAWGGNNQAQLYTYDASGQRIKRKVDGVETWAVYGFGGEMVAEYAVSGAASSPQKEYGYRNGQLLITAEPPLTTSGTQNVNWTNAVGVSVSTNNLTKNTSDGWTSGASSSQSFAAGDGYIEFTASETNTYRMIGLSSGDTNQDFTDIDFAAYLGGGGNGTLCIYEAGVNRGCQSTFVSGDVIRVAVESGVVKYKKNGTTFYTSTVSPSYPLNADTALYSNGSTINNVKISGNLSTGSGTVHWLVPDQLGTPRMIFDQTGSLANVKRHDYLPFGEELFGGTEQNPGPGDREPSQGYSGGDGVRQQFASKERDVETGLDYFLARYHSRMQGRFVSADPYFGSVFLELPQSWNRYSYCINDPLNTIDPDGLAWVHDTETNLYIWVPDSDYRTGNAYFDNQDRYEALTQEEIGPNGVTFTVGEVSGVYDTPENRALMGQEVYLGADGKVHLLYPPRSDEMQSTPEGRDEGDRIGAHNRQAIADFLGATLTNDWRFIPNPNVTHNEFEERAKTNGFSWYLDFHPDHYGGSDYEGQVNGTWYHLTIDYGTSPTTITAFEQDHFYRPSGMHRIDWLKSWFRPSRKAANK